MTEGSQPLLTTRSRRARRPAPLRSLLAALALATSAAACARGGGVSGEQARRLVESGARLVDVRTAGEFAAGHLPGAINIPVQELGTRLEELEPKQAPIVVYCRSGARSGAAARLLERAGHSAVHDLGAISRW